MKKIITNYETLLKITNHISMSKNPEDIPYLVVESMECALEIDGCAFFLYDRKSHKLKLSASVGLSKDYIEKGPISSIKSIASSLKDGPILIYDVLDDPRIQYPKEAKREGISTILSVPIIFNEAPIGALRAYTKKPWEASLEDVNFVQAVAQISSMALEMGRLNKGLKASIEILKSNRDPKSIKSPRRTPYEGVPISTIYPCLQ